MVILFAFFIGVIAFLGLLYLTNFITRISGLYGDMELFAIYLVGAVVISCTYIVVTKIHDLKESIKESDDDLL